MEKMSSGQTAKTFLDTVQAQCLTNPDLHIACELFSQAGYKHIDDNDVIACCDYIIAYRAYKAALEAQVVALEAKVRAMI